MRELSSGSTTPSEGKRVAPGRCLTRITPTQEGRATVYMVHDVFGLSTPYQSLIPHLNANIFGFNDPYFGMEHGGFQSIEAMATYYLEQILPPLSLDSETILAGWSFGGTVAAEMAIQLQKSGLPVHLILIDAPHIDESTPAYADLDEFIKRQGHPETLAECLLQEVRKNVKLLRAYDLPHPLSNRSRITSIKALRHPEMNRDLTEEDGALFDERNGWGEKLGKNWTTIPVQSSHFQLFTEPNVSGVAAAIIHAVEGGTSTQGFLC